RADQLKVTADGLAMTERDRLAVQYSVGHFAILFVYFLVAAASLLAGFRRRRRFDIGWTLARRAGYIDLIALARQGCFLALHVAARRHTKGGRGAGRFFRLFAFHQAVALAIALAFLQVIQLRVEQIIDPFAPGLVLDLLGQHFRSLLGLAFAALETVG